MPRTGKHAGPNDALLREVHDTTHPRLHVGTRHCMTCCVASAVGGVASRMACYALNASTQSRAQPCNAWLPLPSRPASSLRVADQGNVHVCNTETAALHLCLLRLALDTRCMRGQTICIQSVPLACRPPNLRVAFSVCEQLGAHPVRSRPLQSKNAGTRPTRVSRRPCHPSRSLRSCLQQAWPTCTHLCQRLHWEPHSAMSAAVEMPLAVDAIAGGQALLQPEQHPSPRLQSSETAAAPEAGR